MALLRALLYLLAVVLLVLAACGVRARVSFALLGAATALFAYSLPDLVVGFR